MFPDAIHTFRHELVSTVLVSAFLGSITLPFKKLIAAYKETKKKLEDISTELVQQRTNCLATLQRQGDKQIELLSKSVDVLSEIRTDMKITLEHLRDTRNG